MELICSLVVCVAAMFFLVKGIKLGHTSYYLRCSILLASAFTMLHVFFRVHKLNMAVFRTICLFLSILLLCCGFFVSTVFYPFALAIAFVGVRTLDFSGECRLNIDIFKTICLFLSSILLLCCGFFVNTIFYPFALIIAFAGVCTLVSYLAGKE